MKKGAEVEESKVGSETRQLPREVAQKSVTVSGTVAVNEPGRV